MSSYLQPFTPDGATEAERMRVDQVLEAVIEIKTEFYSVCYDHPEEVSSSKKMCNPVPKISLDVVNLGLLGYRKYIKFSIPNVLNFQHFNLQ